jgi:hypothetical protein
MSQHRRQFVTSLSLLTIGSAVGTGVAAADDHDGEAGLRVAHASPDAPAVDVYLDGAKAVGGLEFQSVTDYLEVAAGEHEVSVTVAGTDTTVFGPVTVELEAEDYTALASGEVSSDDSSFGVQLLEDTNGANVGEDEARVRAIHASPDAPAVDVTVDDDALTLFEDLAFGESSEYAIVGAADYEVEIRPAGGGDAVYETAVTLQGGSTYTVFAVGYLSPDDEPSDEAFALLPIEDASAPPRGKGEGRGGGDDEDDDAEEDEAEEDQEEEEKAEEEEEEEEGEGKGKGRGR